MMVLAWASLRARLSSFVATFLSIMLAATLIGSFATLVQAGLAEGVGDADRETLLIMGAVVGSWGSVIALFSLASTLSIVVRQRNSEIALLRVIGGTPRQARRMIRVEAFLVALAGSVAGAALAVGGGTGLLELLRATDVVSDSVSRAGMGTVLAGTVAALVAVSLLAATIAGRRATRGSSMAAIAQVRTIETMPRWRVVVGLLLVTIGIAMGTFTLVAMRDAEDPYAAMQACGSAGIMLAIGLATLAPALLRATAVVLRPLLGLFGAPGYLAGFNASRRAQVLSGVLGPVIVLTATAVGTVMLVGIDDRTLAALTTDSQEQQAVTLLNYVVTGMIAVFAAIMVLNALVAVIGQRRAEFRRLHLIGATPQQVRSSVLVEAVTIAAVGASLGLLSSVVTVLPYSVVRGEGVVPDGQLWVPAAIVVVAAVLTVAGSAVAARRTMAAASRISRSGAGALL